MSLPEIMGDPCASELRNHALALIRATAASEKLTRSHPSVAHTLADLCDSVTLLTSEVLDTLALEAGIPAEGESISPVGGRMGDYRVDRSSGCWVWMRSVTARGYPVLGRKAKGRENVPAKIYWMLAHGPLGKHEIIVRTCGSRLCVNPAHARLTDRRDYGAECMRGSSTLDWDAVREIRSTLCTSRTGLRERAAALAARFQVGEHSILDIFRNKVWVDKEYTPGFEVTCAGPGCDVLFRTTSTVRKYHSEECRAAATVAPSGTQSRQSSKSISPERRARQEAALQAEAAAAEAEWSDIVTDGPRTSVWSVASMDQPMADNGATLHDVLAAREVDGDPAVELERKFARELLAGLTEDSVAAMDDAELATVQARLAAADVRPSTSRLP